LVLGYINPEYFLGGERELDVEAAREAIDECVAAPLGCSVEEAARRIKQIVDANIGQDLADLSERRDLDLDAVFAFGGAGPLHAPGFAEEAGISTVVTFPFGSVFNAFGQSAMDVVHTYTEAVGSSLVQVDERELEETVVSMENEAIRDMRGEGFDPDDIIFEIEAVCNHSTGERQLLSIPDEMSASDFGDLVDAYVISDREVTADEVEFEAVRLIATVPIPDPDIPRVDIGDTDPSAARQGERTAHWINGSRETPIYEYESLLPGHTIVGPAVVEATDTTYALPEGWDMRIDEYANGILERQ
jgi:N-methylhydantoinase A/acetophenone carboxylase